MATSPSSRRKGWAYDKAADRLAAEFNGTEVFDFDANDITIPSGVTVNFDGPVDFDGTVDLSGATVTEPTRTAIIDMQTLVRGADGAELAITETAGDFYRSIGTNQWLILGEVTNNETEVSVGVLSVVLPQNYKAGGTISIVVGIDVTGTGTLGTTTVDFECYLQNATTGAVGSDLVTTAATAFSATEGLKTFVVTPTGLVAGDRLNIKMTTSVVVSDMNNAQAQISALYLSLQVDK